MYCIPILARNNDEALEKISKAVPLADMVEIRLDLMDTFNLNEIVRVVSKPILVTYRTEKEGGGGKADPETYTRYLLNSIEEGADFIDVELSMPSEWRRKIFAAKRNSEIVVSMHINDGTPSSKDLGKIFNECIKTKPDIVKIVTRAKAWEDNLRVLQLIPKAQKLGVKIVSFCMGPMGRISRVLSHLMGGYFTFTSLEPGEESAEGQIPLAEMKEILKHF